MYIVYVINPHGQNYCKFRQYCEHSARCDRILPRSEVQATPLRGRGSPSCRCCTDPTAHSVRARRYGEYDVAHQATKHSEPAVCAPNRGEAGAARQEASALRSVSRCPQVCEPCDYHSTGCTQCAGDVRANGSTFLLVLHVLGNYNSAASDAVCNRPPLPSHASNQRERRACFLSLWSMLVADPLQSLRWSPWAMCNRQSQQAAARRPWPSELNPLFNSHIPYVTSDQ